MTKVTIDRELLERVVKADASNGASSVDLVDGWKAMEQIRAILAAPRQPEGEGLEVVATVQGDNVSRHIEWNPLASAFRHEIGAELVAGADAQRAIAELRGECEAMAKNLRGKHAVSGATYAHLIAERDTLRQQLAEAQSNTDKWCDVACSQRDEADRLAAQRDKLAGLLRKAYGVDDPALLEQIDAALAEVGK